MCRSIDELYNVAARLEMDTAYQKASRASADRRGMQSRYISKDRTHVDDTKLSLLTSFAFVQTDKLAYKSGERSVWMWSRMGRRVHIGSSEHRARVYHPLVVVVDLKQQPAACCVAETDMVSQTSTAVMFKCRRVPVPLACASAPQSRWLTSRPVLSYVRRLPGTSWVWLNLQKRFLSYAVVQMLMRTDKGQRTPGSRWQDSARSKSRCEYSY